jgi:Mn-dependent DtxR family transcriptional regulator
MNNITSEGKKSEQRAEDMQRRHNEASEHLAETTQVLERKTEELAETARQLASLRRKTARLIRMLNDVSTCLVCLVIRDIQDLEPVLRITIATGHVVDFVKGVML